jgi:hypothetical protein
MLKMDIYNMLQQKYIQLPMLFPIQTIQSKDFTGLLQAGANTPFDVTQTTALSYCNSMFIVFRDDVHTRTVFTNPMINFRVNIDGKFFPREEYKTVDDVRNWNLFLDAINFNNNPLYSIGKDLQYSLQPYYNTRTATNNLPNSVKNAVVRVYDYEYDHSNFAIGIPFCQDDDFMAGISSGGTIQVELIGSRDSLMFTTHDAVPPTALYVEDCIAKFRAVKPAGESQIKITKASIEQIIAGASM